MATALDTHRAVKELVQAGASEPLAEAVTRLVKDRDDAARGELVTRADLSALEGRLEVRIEARIEAAKSDLIRWFAGVMIAQGLAIVGATVALVKLLPG